MIPVGPSRCAGSVPVTLSFGLARYLLTPAPLKLSPDIILGKNWLTTSIPILSLCPICSENSRQGFLSSVI